MNKKLIIILSLLIIMSIFTSGCEFSATTAKYKNVQTASQIDPETKKPVTVTAVFQTDTPMIYVTGQLANAPEGTKVKIVWKYLDMEPVYTIDQLELLSKDIDTYFSFNLSRPDTGWPPGKYEAELYIDDKLEQTVPFEVQ